MAEEAIESSQTVTSSRKRSRYGAIDGSFGFPAGTLEHQPSDGDVSTDSSQSTVIAGYQRVASGRRFVGIDQTADGICRTFSLLAAKATFLADLVADFAVERHIQPDEVLVDYPSRDPAVYRNKRRRSIRRASLH